MKAITEQDYREFVKNRNEIMVDGVVIIAKVQPLLLPMSRRR